MQENAIDGIMKLRRPRRKVSRRKVLATPKPKKTEDHRPYPKNSLRGPSTAPIDRPYPSSPAGQGKSYRVHLMCFALLKSESFVVGSSLSWREAASCAQIALTNFFCRSFLFSQWQNYNKFLSKCRYHFLIVVGGGYLGSGPDPEKLVLWVPGF